MIRKCIVLVLSEDEERVEFLGVQTADVTKLGVIDVLHSEDRLLLAACSKVTDRVEAERRIRLS